MKFYSRPQGLFEFHKNPQHTRLLYEYINRQSQHFAVFTSTIESNSYELSYFLRQAASSHISLGYRNHTEWRWRGAQNAYSPTSAHTTHSQWCKCAAGSISLRCIGARRWTAQLRWHHNFAEACPNCSTLRLQVKYKWNIIFLCIFVYIYVYTYLCIYVYMSSAYYHTS